MTIVLSLVMITALLIFMVYALHKYQLKRKEETVDRTIPLPPLEFGLQALERQIQKSTATGVGVNCNKHTTEPKEGKSRVTNAKTAKDLQEFRHLNTEGGDSAGTVEALQLFRGKYPQLGAFKQSCVILRRQIKDQINATQSFDYTLAILYKTSALAAFFHDPDTELQPLTKGSLRKVCFDDWESLPMPYDLLGFQYINLLTKADIRLIVKTWGEPRTHTHVRQHHKDAWLQLLASTAAN